MLRIVAEKFIGFNTDLHLLFIDFKQGYDSEVIILIKSTLDNSRSKVKIQGQTSEAFPVKRGFKQRDTLPTVTTK